MYPEDFDEVEGGGGGEEIVAEYKQPSPGWMTNGALKRAGQFHFFEKTRKSFVPLWVNHPWTLKRKQQKENVGTQTAQEHKMLGGKIWEKANRLCSQ